MKNRVARISFGNPAIPHHFSGVRVLKSGGEPVALRSRLRRVCLSRENYSIFKLIITYFEGFVKYFFIVPVNLS